MKYIFLILGLVLLHVNLWAQKDSSYVVGKVVDNSHHPLVGATVYWANKTMATYTDNQGMFKIARVSNDSKLIASYVGYKADTIETVKYKKHALITFELFQGQTLDKVEITGHKASTFSNSLEPIKKDVMSEHELQKAACCNLSESFETNPSIDVSFTDAVTGTKQIQMLGLAGPYIQITRENMPDIRGLSAVYGLTFVPGPWVEAIHLNKGAGSVVNGFESITGQIDVQLRNSFTMDKLYVNGFANQNGRYEMNVAVKDTITEHFATSLLLHGKLQYAKADMNSDGFIDMPIGSQFIGLQRWDYEGKHGMHMQLGIKGTYLESLAGQNEYTKNSIRDTLNPWGMLTDIKRIEGWTKIGKVFEHKPGFSLGFQSSVSNHLQNSFIGLHSYNAHQKSGYANIIFQGILGNTNHIFKTGSSIQYDEYNETFDGVNFDRIEAVPGVFGEYAYSYKEKFNAVIGLRQDYHNEYGFFTTPRIHLRYAPTETWTIRMSGGRGQRSANILSENSNVFASSRKIEIQSKSTYGYGLFPEIAWNYGGNITKTFRMFYRRGSISADVYRTFFENQIVVDFVSDSHRAVFYNLDGVSYSNSIQTQLDYELIKRLDLRIAYRWYDVQTTYNGLIQKKPLLSQHRAFINMGYKTKDMWMFDYTVNWQGPKPLPKMHDSMGMLRNSESSGYFLMNAQISKRWHEKIDMYVGVENLTNFMQHNPIVSASEPYSKDFDSSIIWGPIYGREWYAGFRYRIN